jgi:hypothetical protein
MDLSDRVQEADRQQDHEHERDPWRGEEVKRW